MKNRIKKLREKKERIKRHEDKGKEKKTRTAETKPTAFNTRYMLRRGQAPPPASAMARSVSRYAPSFPRHCSGTFPAARLAAGNVVYLKRYVPFFLKLLEKYYENY
jgi:hypothetical protein